MFPPVDRALRDLIADRRTELRPPPARMSLEEFRGYAAAFMGQAPAPEVAAVEEHSFAEASGRRIRVRLYRPSLEPSLGTILFCHGGGFVLGDLDSHDGMCRMLARYARCAVVAIDYRRAPEHPFPAAVEDCVAAARWVSKTHETLSLPSSLALVGDSAGGHVAVGAMLTLGREAQSIRHLGLIYPMIDPGCTAASLNTYGLGGYLLTRAAIEWFWSLYLPTPSSPRDARAWLLEADVRGFPSTTLITAALDPLRDEAHAFAERLRDADVPLEVREEQGMVHGFVLLSHLTARAGEALQYLGSRIQASLCS